VNTQDAAVARLAVGQLGLVTRAQLLASGVAANAVRHRVRAGRLRPVHPGTYATSPAPLTPEQRCLAAVLACGPGAVLSHGSAAALWRILPAPPGPVEVLRPGARRDGPAGVRVHRTQDIPPDETIVHRGVPATTPARTLLDLAATGPAGRLERALEEARALRLLDAAQLAALGTSGRRGAAPIRALLADAPGFTRSEAERRLRSLVRRARLPAPRTNVRLHEHEVDFHWPDRRLVVEVDGYVAHAGPVAFERDRRRDQDLAARGLRVVRVTWRQLAQEPDAVAARLAAVLLGA